MSCPILYGDAVKRYGMGLKDIADWCSLGCSVDCGRLLDEKMKRRNHERRNAGTGENGVYKEPSDK